jgi:hypothetical protein
MVPPLHIKKQDSFSRRYPLDSKKDTGTSTASLATVPAAAVGAIVRKRGTQLTPTQARRPPGHHRHSVVANAAVSAALFWALVQWFDPATTGISTTGTTLDPASLSSQSANGGLTNDNAQNGQERILSHVGSGTCVGATVAMWYSTKQAEVDKVLPLTHDAIALCVYS